MPVVGEGLVDTGKLIVKEDGTFYYKILIPVLYDRDIEFAASELQYAIQLTTGYIMEIPTYMKAMQNICPSEIRFII